MSRRSMIKEGIAAAADLFRGLRREARVIEDAPRTRPHQAPRAEAPPASAPHAPAARPRAPEAPISRPDISAATNVRPAALHRAEDLDGVRNVLSEFRGNNISNFSDAHTLNNGIDALEAGLRSKGLIADSVQGARLRSSQEVADVLRSGRAVSEREFETLASSYRTRHASHVNGAAGAADNVAASGSRGVDAASPTRAQITLARRHDLDVEDVMALSPQARAELARGSTMASSPQIVGNGIAGLASTGLRMLPKWAVTSVSALALSATALVGGTSIYTLFQSNPDNLGPISRRIVNMGDKFLPGGDFDAELSGAGEMIYNRLTTDSDYLARTIRENLGLEISVTKNEQNRTVIDPDSMREVAQKFAGNSFFSDSDVRKAFGIFMAVNAGLKSDASPSDIVAQLATRADNTGLERAAAGALAGQNALAGAISGNPTNTQNEISSDQINLTQVFQNLRDYGNLQPAELDTIQTAYNNAAGNDRALNPSDPSDKQAFIAGLGNLRPETRNTAIEAFGMTP